jgi:Domain of unknown function (DUF5666)
VRFGIPITALAAVLLVACGGAAARTSTSAARPTPAGSPRAGFGGNAVGGKLTQLNGAQLVLAAQSGSVDVTYDSSTRMLRTSAGSLAQAVPGTCVNVTGQKDASGAVTATTVNLMLDMNGVCTQQGAGAGPGGGAGAGAGAGGGQGRGTGRQGANPNLAFVRGKITAVQGQALTVLDVSGAPTAVNVSDTTRYTRTEAAAASQLAVGQCILASGQKDAASGAVAARQLSITDPGPNGCATGFQGGGPRQNGSPAPSA